MSACVVVNDDPDNWEEFWTGSQWTPEQIAAMKAVRDRHAPEISYISGPGIDWQKWLNDGKDTR
jgi:hypothetical protein